MSSNYILTFRTSALSRQFAFSFNVNFSFNNSESNFQKPALGNFVLTILETHVTALWYWMILIILLYSQRPILCETFSETSHMSNQDWIVGLSQRFQEKRWNINKNYMTAHSEHLLTAFFKEYCKSWDIGLFTQSFLRAFNRIEQTCSIKSSS